MGKAHYSISSVVAAFIFHSASSVVGACVPSNNDSGVAVCFPQSASFKSGSLGIECRFSNAKCMHLYVRVDAQAQYCQDNLSKVQTQ